jgi:hypothetical protein
MHKAAVIVLFLALALHAQGPGVPDKNQRTPPQRKIDSQLLVEIYRARGEAEAKRVPPAPTGVRIDARGRALVDIRATVTPRLQAAVRRLGGRVVATSARDRSTIAFVPLLKLETLAADATVQFIAPAAEAITNR